MSSSFVEFKDYGFWASDGFVEAMQLYLIYEIEIYQQNNQHEATWLNEYKVELAVQSLPIIYGGMSMELDGFIISDERKQLIVEFLNAIIEKISASDNYFTGLNLHKLRKRALEILIVSDRIKFRNQEDYHRTLNNSGWRYYHPTEDAKNNYSHSFKLLKMLINGELDSSASSPETYWDY